MTARSVGVIGLGLMGSALCRALRAHDATIRLVGVELDSGVRERAVSTNAVDEVSAVPSSALAACELVILCAPIAAIEALLAPVSAHMAPGAVLSDVGGVKGPIVAAARDAVRAGVAFVGAHPMFGGEAGGFDAGRADLWRGGKVAVCTDGATPEAFERVASLHRALGAEIVACTADEHDTAVAYVSHLPYVVSTAIACTAARGGALCAALAGRGFDDVTRLSRFVYDVQGEVARRNPHLREAMAVFDGELRALEGALGMNRRAPRERR